MELENLKQEIENIKKRNQKVELDKKWETCWTRRISICILTYIIVVIYTYFTKEFSNIFFNSAVPVIGFILSTLSIDGIKKIWSKRI